MSNQLTFTIQFNVNPPNTQQALDAINTSLKGVGASVATVGQQNVNTSQQAQKEQSKLTTFVREQRTENRLQNFMFRESTQAIGALSMGVTMFGMTGSESMKQLSSAVGGGILAFQGMDFVLGALGIGGTMGLAIAGVAGLVALLMSLDSQQKRNTVTSKMLSDELQKQFDLRVKLGQIPPPKFVNELRDDLAATERGIEVAKAAGQNYDALETRRLQLLAQIKDAEKSAGDVALDALRKFYPEAMERYDNENAIVEAGNRLAQARIELMRQGRIEEVNKLDALIDKLKAFDKANAETAKLQSDVDAAKRKQDADSLSLDNAQKLKLSQATTDKEREAIETDFAKRRIELERESTVAILGLQQLVVAAQLKATSDPAKIRELQQQLRGLTADIEAANVKAGLQTTGVGLDQSGKDAERDRELKAENDQYQQERLLNDQREKDQKRTKDALAQYVDSQVDDIKKLAVAKRQYSADEKAYRASADKTERDHLKSKLSLDRQEIDSLQQTIQARQEAMKQDILAAGQSYDASKNFGDQMKKLVLDRIRAIIAEAVATQIAKVIAMIPWPFNLIAAPAAGLAVEALLQQLIPKFGQGGVVVGKSHAQGGTIAEVEDGEFIVRRSVAQDHMQLLRALNRGAVPRYAIGGGVGSSSSGSGAIVDLKKEFAALRRAITKMQSQVVIESQFDIQKYTRANKKMDRVRAAYAL